MSEKQQRERMKFLWKKYRATPIGLDGSTLAEPVEAPVQQKSVRDNVQGFLPFVASAAFEAQYLRQVVEQGGVEAQRYKIMSYDLLQLEPGMQVLDVGCGAGVDLPPLAERVGETGQVIGLDLNPDQLRAAQVNERNNVQLVEGDAQRMPFPNGQFDRVRIDRVLQHISQPAKALAEMWRVLRPGGILTIIEPDWKMVAVFPGSPAGGDDDHTLSAVLAYKQREGAHALIGRQLYSLLRVPGGAWENVQVKAEAFTLTSWPVVDAVLLLSEMARALVGQEPALADEVNAWLHAIEEAAQRGAFLASVQLFFARAHKV